MKIEIKWDMEMKMGNGEQYIKIKNKMKTAKWELGIRNENTKYGIKMRNQNTK